MAQHSQNIYPTDPSRLDPIKAAIIRNQTLHYPNSIVKLKERERQIPPNLKPINRSTFGGLKK